MESPEESLKLKKRYVLKDTALSESRKSRSVCYLKVAVAAAHLKFWVRGSQNSVPKHIRKPIYNFDPVDLQASSCIYTAGGGSTDEEESPLHHLETHTENKFRKCLHI